MAIRKTDTVGAIVTGNLQAASVFNAYSIDYYSKGDRTLEHACLEEKAPISNLIEELNELACIEEQVCDFTRMNSVELSTYILHTHHKFTEQRLVFIRNTLQRLVSFYASQHSALWEVQNTFNNLSVYLTVHMKHEEFIVFPYIHRLVKTRHKAFSSVETIDRPITAMKDDHDHEVQTLKSLAVLTNDFIPPRSTDYSFSIAYSAMRELVDDLKIHMHLENNILFPNAIRFAKLQQ